MRKDNNLVLDHIARKMTVMENALQQVIEMQSLVYMEIELLKKKVNTINNSTNPENVESNNDNDNSSSRSNNDGDLDIAAVQRILRNQQLSGNESQVKQL